MPTLDTVPWSPLQPRIPVVGVTADRRGDDQAVLFQRAGFEVCHGPMMQTVVLDDGPLRAATDRLVEHPCAYLVANTGIGIRTWLQSAHGWGIEPELKASLAQSRIAARGPKVAGAIRSAGLEVWWRAPTEQLADVRRQLLEVGIKGRRVAVQRHGEDDLELSHDLVAGGAEVIDLPVYRWRVPSEAHRAVALIEAVVAGDIDAVTFTSGPAVRNMMLIAEGIGRREDLLVAMNGPVLTACVGPVCAGVAADEGLLDVVVPEHWRLGSLVRLVTEELGGTPT
ncbi:MAG: hypothetical protein NVSMB4_11850 [Acidimicrobiales bacterium]